MSALARILGPENLARLSAACGGTRLYVPKYYGTPPKHIGNNGGGRDTSKRLARLVGPDLGLLLVLHFGDSVIYVPKRRDAPTVDRRKLKRLARNPNLSATTIARRLGCTTRTVEKARAKLNGRKGAQ